MEPIAILHADTLDLLFENRNKSYGAYPLRKYYHRRLWLAMAAVAGLVLIFSCSFLYWRSKSGFAAPQAIDGDHFLITVPLGPAVLPPVLPKAPRPVQHTATAALTPLLIVPDQQVSQTIADVTELKNAAIGLRTEAGPPFEEGDNSRQGTGAAADPKPDSAEAAPAVLEHADLMPEFPGGPEALKRFLIKNLRMPETVLEPGSQVRVISKFVVGADGKVSGLETVLSGGAAFDGEVRRVISRMPDWKPGIQNHRKVAVYFNLPVYFVVPAEN